MSWRIFYVKRDEFLYVAQEQYAINVIFSCLISFIVVLGNIHLTGLAKVFLYIHLCFRYTFNRSITSTMDGSVTSITFIVFLVLVLLLLLLIFIFFSLLKCVLFSFIFRQNCKCQSKGNGKKTFMPINVYYYVYYIYVYNIVYMYVWMCR